MKVKYPLPGTEAKSVSEHVRFHVRSVVCLQMINTIEFTEIMTMEPKMVVALGAR